MYYGEHYNVHVLVLGSYIQSNALRTLIIIDYGIY